MVLVKCWRLTYSSTRCELRHHKSRNWAFIFLAKADSYPIDDCWGGHLADCAPLWIWSKLLCWNIYSVKNTLVCWHPVISKEQACSNTSSKWFQNWTGKQISIKANLSPHCSFSTIQPLGCLCRGGPGLHPCWWWDPHVASQNPTATSARHTSEAAGFGAPRYPGLFVGPQLTWRFLCLGFLTLSSFSQSI